MSGAGVDAYAWGIPRLNSLLAAPALVPPLIKWGTQPRGGGNPGGSIYFYTDDYKFSRLWLDPSRLLAAQPEVVVEVNFSTHSRMARAEVLWAIYRKRVLARAWQDAGIAVVVDLDIEPRFRDLALLGVPLGWRSYATRAHRSIPFAEVERDHALAVAHAGVPDPLFVVFGGGNKVRDACLERGWEWVPEHRQVIAGKVAPYGSRIERSGVEG